MTKQFCDYCGEELNEKIGYYKITIETSKGKHQAKKVICEQCFQNKELLDYDLKC